MSNSESLSTHLIDPNIIGVVRRAELHHPPDKTGARHLGRYYRPGHKNNPFPDSHTIEVEHKVTDREYWVDFTHQAIAELHAGNYSKKDRVLVARYTNKLLQLLDEMVQDPNFGSEAVLVVRHHENTHVLQEVKWQISTLIQHDLPNLQYATRTMPSSRRELWFWRLLLSAEMEVQAFAEQGRHLNTPTAKLMLWLTLRRAVGLLQLHQPGQADPLTLLRQDAFSETTTDDQLAYRLAAMKLLLPDNDTIVNLVTLEPSQTRVVLAQALQTWLDRPEEALRSVHHSTFAQQQNDHLAELCQQARTRLTELWQSTGCLSFDAFLALPPEKQVSNLLPESIAFSVAILKVLYALSTHKATTREQLLQDTSLNERALSQTLAELIASGYVIQHEAADQPTIYSVKQFIKDLILGPVDREWQRRDQG